MSRTLQNADISKYMDMANAFESMNERELEMWRQNAERSIQQAGLYQDMTPVLKGRWMKCVLQQSISANLLNEKYGKSYAVADFDESCNVVMREPDKRLYADKSARPLPSYSGSEDVADFDTGISL